MKLIINRDVEFNEDGVYNWKIEKVNRSATMPPLSHQQDEETNDQSGSPTQAHRQELVQVANSSLKSLSKRTKSSAEIYEHYNLAIMELENFEEASKQKVWRRAMEKEIKMIERIKHGNQQTLRMKKR